MLVLGGGLVASASIFAASYVGAKSSTVAAFLLIGVPTFVGVAVLISRFRPMGHRLQSFAKVLFQHKLWAGGAGALVIAGAIYGYEKRRELVDRCETAMATANAKKAALAPGAPELDSAFASAFDVCVDAKLTSEAASMRQERALVAEAAAKEEAQREREAQKARDAAFALALANGTTAFQRKEYQKACEHYLQAEGLGTLPAAAIGSYATALIESAKQHLEQKRPHDALAGLEKASRLDPGRRGLEESLARAREAARAADIDLAIEDAKAVAADKEKCGLMETLKQAWAKLRPITREDPRFSAAALAAAGLERCRRKVLDVAVKGIQDVMIAQRESWRKRFEQGFLEEGLDVRVGVSGLRKNQATITYVLFNRAWAYKLTDGETKGEGTFLGEMEKMGFERVTFTDGFGDSYHYDLKPTKEDESTIAPELGLAEPFVLK